LKRVKKIALKDFSVENATQYMKRENQSPSPNFLNNVTISGQLEIFKLPINLELVNNYNPLNNFNLSQNNLFKFDFIKPGFEQFYQGKLNAFKNFKQQKLGSLNLETILKKEIEKQVVTITKNKLADYPALQSYLSNPTAVKELLSMDEKELKSRMTTLLNGAKGEIKQQSSELLNEKNKQSEELLQQGVKEITDYVMSLKSEINSAGLDEETIALLEKFASNKIGKKELENFFISQLSKQPKLQGAQKFYSKIKEFQAGNFAHQLPGSFMNRDLFLNGFNFSLKTQRGPVNIGLSSNKDIGTPKDYGFDNSTYSYPKLYSYINIPTTNFSFGNGKLSWTGVYDQEFSKSSGVYSSSLPKNNMVFTISQNLNIQNLGKLTVDISKSATQLKNLSMITPDRLVIDRNTMGNYFRDDFLETMSIGFNHIIDAKKTGLNSNVYFNYSGIGFQNPAQQGLASMNMRFGGNIKQNFFKNKLSLQLRSDIKNTPISAESSAHWRNYNIQLDSRIRLSKSYTLNFKYIGNGVNKVSQDVLPMYGSQKLQADFNANYKLGEHYSFSHITFGRQVMKNTTSLQQPDFLMLNYSQSLLFKDFSLSGNLFYNRELGTSILIGNMLNSDVALQYTVFRSISMASGVTYLDNQNTARQVGIKQNIQLMLKKHFDINAYVDLRKNLINPSYPDLFSTGRAEFSIRYYLDRQ
jgi:hypothetical protein